jgi:hypothetical protein
MAAQHLLLTRVAACVLTAVVLAGCASAHADAGAPAAKTATTSTASPPGTSSATPSPTPGDGHDRMAVPAKRAGPLTGKDMPRASALGHGWRFRVDNGDQEDGYAGNGTPTVQRDPGEVAGLAVPLGCVDRGHLPRPRWALESDYRHTSTATLGLVIRLRFRTAADATTFMKQRDTALAACSAQTSRSGPNSTGLVQSIHRVRGWTVSTRTEAGDLHDGSAWTEIVGIASPDTDLVLVAVNAVPTTPVARQAIAKVVSLGA